MRARDLLGIASRNAVNQALSRLVKSEQLLRATPGLYVAPIASRFGKRAPAAEKVVFSLASMTHEVTVRSGAYSANALGLTQQVPVRELFLSSGRSRVLHLGNIEVTILHASNWQMALGDSLAGNAIRALAWMGAEHARSAARTLKQQLPDSEWQDLQAVGYMLPAWMADLI